MKSRGSRMGQPVKRWRTLSREDCSIIEHKDKISLYDWLEENGLETRDVHVLCNEGYGNGWEIVLVPRTYKRDWK